MGDILANWISIGDSMYERVELYSNQLEKTFDQFLPAPFGGPILVLHDNIVGIHAASGAEIAQWKWRNGGKIIKTGWSLEQELVFVMDDGTVHIYTIYGELCKSLNMGQEAKDVKIRDAQVFRSSFATGVAILTTSNRFFIVNNLKEPRIRRFFDVALPHPGKTSAPGWPWRVWSAERHAKILYMTDKDLMILSLSEVKAQPLSDLSEEIFAAKHIILSPDYSKVAILSTDKYLWIGAWVQDDRLVKIVQAQIQEDLTEIAWCGIDAVIGFAPESSQCLIVSATESKVPLMQAEFFMGFISVVSEMDSARVYSLYSQEMFRKLPESLVRIFAIGSVSPGAKLRLAAEEFIHASHRADEYIRSLGSSLELAVEDCFQAAANVQDANHQKTLMKAAQFGQAFCPSSNASSNASEKFSTICKSLRVINALKDYKIGIPMTMTQYETLGPVVIIDRLLQRRLFPLASKIVEFLQIPSGASRVLAHWACYKVAQDDLDDSTIAETIKKRLQASGKNSEISYCDIASKAIEVGRSQLAIQLLECETSVNRQVPLLIKLGQEAIALNKALNSGDRDLAYSVILHLRKNFSSSDFHMLIRKSRLGKILYESYCEAHDSDSLQVSLENLENNTF